LPPPIALGVPERFMQIRIVNAGLEAAISVVHFGGERAQCGDQSGQLSVIDSQLRCRGTIGGIRGSHSETP
jgi:hypothetical protein